MHWGAPPTILKLQLSRGPANTGGTPTSTTRAEGSGGGARMRGGDQSPNKCAPKGHWGVAKREEGRA